LGFDPLQPQVAVAEEKGHSGEDKEWRRVTSTSVVKNVGFEMIKINYE
jgi:hypothetical protein